MAVRTDSRYRFLGLEVEYALEADGTIETQEKVAQQLMAVGFKSTNRYWQRHGGCLYVDVATHPEACTPEVQNGYQVLVYDRANEWLLLDRLAQVQPDWEPPL